MLKLDLLGAVVIQLANAAYASQLTTANCRFPDDYGIKTHYSVIILVVRLDWATFAKETCQQVNMADKNWTFPREINRSFVYLAF